MTEKFEELVKSIEKNHWPIYVNCPSGHFYGASGMELTVEELGRLGGLYLNGGKWNGECILTDELVKEAVTYLSDMQERSEDLTEAVMACLEP